MERFIEHTLLEVIRILKISHFRLEMTGIKIASKKKKKRITQNGTF